MATKFFHSGYLVQLVLAIWLAAGFSGTAAAQTQQQQIPSSDYGFGEIITEPGLLNPSFSPTRRLRP